MNRASWLAASRMVYMMALLGAGCGAEDATTVDAPSPVSPGPRQPAYLSFPGTGAGGGSALLDAADFPTRLSEAGAFSDTVALAPLSGILPYEVQAPLWSDGATKQRWLSLPEGSVLGYGEAGRLAFPSGTVLVKHFEMVMDERFPEQRRRLETRFWVVVSSSEQYGVTYRWNAEQTDAEVLRASATEELTIVGADGLARTQSYFYPGPRDCYTCHNEQAGFVLGARVAQLNRPTRYGEGGPAGEQLLAWSSWGMLDTSLDGASLALAPRLVGTADESASLEDRVRSYWDANCSMCHAGADGPVPGWDARFSTPLEEQGLFEAPGIFLGSAPRLITPGSPRDSLIYLRGDTAGAPLRMPPIGRSRVDGEYIELLARWIGSLAPGAL